MGKWRARPFQTPSHHPMILNLGNLDIFWDVEQADVAALMAALVGIDWPVNSVEVIPDVNPTRPGYLKLRDGDKGKAKVGLINAKIILEQYRIKDGSSQFLARKYLHSMQFCFGIEFKRKHALFYNY
jgi:hypothetical protein